MRFAVKEKQNAVNVTKKAFALGANAFFEVLTTARVNKCFFQSIKDISQGQSHLIANDAQNAFGYPCAHSIR